MALSSLENGWKRLGRGMPAILLGTLFNVLDAVSTGLLIFPTGGHAFANLQNKSMSTYIMSSLICQVVMTAGGSLFPGALGAMLIEVLPLMRAVASDIRNALGDDNPAVVPTVMVAYSLSSFIIGIIFLGLGALGVGRLISYFPQTVLTGAIGGIGVSLFILGLELPLPRNHSLSLSNAGSVLFSQDHLPLLLASLLPIVFMCYSVRSDALGKMTKGAVQHPYYVPLYFLVMGVSFWVIVGGLGVEKLGGLPALAAKGWLFSANEAPGGGHESWKDALNYWSLFDFRRVEMWALGPAVTNFILLIVISVLNLPIYVPALALALDVPYSMNHELIGQGAANIIAGACGSLPNILQLSYSVFFSRAGGRRFEGCVVVLLTAALFFVSSYLIRYIPTILASGLVLFLGIELTLEAVWESTKDLIWSEWLVAMATLLACTFIGFAPGIGVGLAAAVVVYTGWGCWDLRAKSGYIERNLAILDQHSRQRQHSLHRSRASAEYTPVLDTSCEEFGIGGIDGRSPRIRLVRLNGYVFFGIIPSVEAQLAAEVFDKKGEKDGSAEGKYIIVDMHAVHRIETAAAKVVRTKARDGFGLTLVLCGFSEASGTAVDLRRAGVELLFSSAFDFSSPTNANCVRVFRDATQALQWCQSDFSRQLRGADNFPVPAQAWPRQQFLALFSASLSGPRALEDPQGTESTGGAPARWKVDAYQSACGTFRRPLAGSGEACFLFVLSGTLQFSFPTPGKAALAADSRLRYNRASLQDTVVGACRLGLSTVLRMLGREGARADSPSESDCTDDNPSASERSQSMGVGHTIYVPSEAGTDESGASDSVLGEEAEKDAMRTDVTEEAPATLISTWPTECSEAVLQADGEGSCWVVQVYVPCTKSSAGSPSIKRLRERAILHVALEARTEP